LCREAFQRDSDNPPGGDDDRQGYGVSLARAASRCCVWLALLRLAWAVELETVQVASASEGVPSKCAYFQRFPSLFATLYVDASRETTRSS